MKVAASTSEIPAATNFGNGYENNYNGLMANHCREEYTRLYTQKQALLRLSITGIQDVTVSGATGSVTVALVGTHAHARGQNLFVEIAEQLGDRLAVLEHEILRYEQDSHQEEADERDGRGARAEVLAFCLPMRPLSNEEFLALPAEARRAYDERRAENISQLVKGGQAA